MAAFYFSPGSVWMPVSISDAFLGTEAVKMNKTESLPSSGCPAQKEHSGSVYVSDKGLSRRCFGSAEDG